jgi:hypothetical protein
VTTDRFPFKRAYGVAGLGAAKFRRLAFVSTAVLTIVGVPAAYAYFQGNGTGQGTAHTSATMQTVTIESVTFTGALRPGGPSVNLLTTVNNPNPFAVSAVNLTSTDITANMPGCGDASHPTGVVLQINTQAASIPPGQSVLTGTALMGTDSDASCAGATFTATLTLAVTG